MTGANKKQIVLDIYTELLQTIWAKTSIIVGPTTVATLLETALFETIPQHPFLEGLQVNPAGLDWSSMSSQGEEVSAEEMRAGFEDLISELYAAFTILTGDVVLRQIDPHLVNLRERLERV